MGEASRSQQGHHPWNQDPIPAGENAQYCTIDPNKCTGVTRGRAGRVEEEKEKETSDMRDIEENEMNRISSLQDRVAAGPIGKDCTTWSTTRRII